MKKIFNIGFLAGLIFISTACEMDNYEGPNASFGGIVIDKTTGKGISTEQPKGFRIRWKELTWGDNVQPDYFYGMPDGKFNWNYAFGYANAEYEITPVEGAFVMPEPQIISLRKGEHKDLTFEVVPFIHIESNYELDGKDLTVRFTATRPLNSAPEGEPPYAITQVYLLISDKTQYVSYQNSGGYNRDISKRITPFGESQLGQEITTVVNLENPGVYHFRIVIQTRNPSNACNFTPVEKIIIQ
jgi:hypothetical protein